MNLKPFLKKLQTVSRDNNVAMLGVFGSVPLGEDTGKSDVDLFVRFTMRWPETSKSSVKQQKIFLPQRVENTPMFLGKT